MSPTRNSVSQSLCARKSASASALQPVVPRWVSEMKMVRWRRDAAGHRAGRRAASRRLRQRSGNDTALSNQHVSAIGVSNQLSIATLGLESVAVS